MGKYNENFTLNPKEIDLIEHALREQIARLSAASLGGVDAEVRENERLIGELHTLLGKLHNKKVWYGQVHPTGVPLG